MDNNSFYTVEISHNSVHLCYKYYANNILYSYCYDYKNNSFDKKFIKFRVNNVLNTEIISNSIGFEFQSKVKKIFDYYVSLSDNAKTKFNTWALSNAQIDVIFTLNEINLNWSLNFKVNFIFHIGFDSSFLYQFRSNSLKESFISFLNFIKNVISNDTTIKINVYDTIVIQEYLILAKDVSKYYGFIDNDTPMEEQLIFEIKTQLLHDVVEVFVNEFLNKEIKLEVIFKQLI